MRAKTIHEDTVASMPIKKKIFFPNLDGLRFFCFLSVFLFHSFYTEFSYLKDSPIYRFIKGNLLRNGNIGVNVFFVLSGFLITYLLLQERKLNGKISVPRFWFRRILRIWPLYFFCVFFGFVLFPALKTFFGQTPNESASFLSYLTFTSNFEILKKGFPDASVLGVLWSVAVEEQFYLIWPLILAILPQKYYLYFFASLLSVTFVFRATYHSQMMNEYHTLSCIGDMVIGATGAYLVHTSASFRDQLENMSRRFIVLIYLAFTVIYFFREPLFFSNPYVTIFERSLIATVALFIILEQNYAKKSFLKFSDFRLVSKLGIISYGLYCLHFIGILTTLTLTRILHLNNKLWEVLCLETGIAFCLTILIGYFSYRFIERYFLRLKDKFSFIVQ
jgi:peptidoglycan/LPS O-acetylase OafA/YrhL